MNNDKEMELDFLSDCINDLQAFMRNAINCETVTENDYYEIGLILNELEDKEMKLEIELENIKMEEN